MMKKYNLEHEVKQKPVAGISNIGEQSAAGSVKFPQAVLV
jgi:hypothetical protein